MNEAQPSCAPRPTVLVVGNGMVGHRFVEAAVERGVAASHRLVVIGEEWRRAYDRVHLSSVFDGVDAADLALGDGSPYDHPGVDLVLGDPVVTFDSVGHRAVTASGREIAFDTAVLATGSAPFVPPIAGTDAQGVFVYRTLDDLDAIREWAAGCRSAAVVGGGLLGLEAANALRLLGLTTTVVEFAPRLMAVQLDEGAGARCAGTSRGSAWRCARAPRRARCASTAAEPSSGSRSPTAIHSTPTWWSSPPASARATSSPATPVWRWGSAEA